MGAAADAASVGGTSAVIGSTGAGTNATPQQGRSSSAAHFTLRKWPRSPTFEGTAITKQLENKGADEAGKTAGGALPGIFQR